MKYIAIPDLAFIGDKVFRFETLNEARLAAHGIAIKEGRKVEVFQLVGTQQPRTDWVEPE